MARFSVTACHVQMKGKAYNKFSLPPNKKATAGKARALRLRGGARNPPRRPQRSLSKTNQSLSPVTSTGRVRFMQMAIRPVSLSGFGLQLLASHYSLSAPKYSLQGSPLAQCPCSPSLHSPRPTGAPTPKLGGSDCTIWSREAAGNLQTAPGSLHFALFPALVSTGWKSDLRFRGAKGPVGLPDAQGCGSPTPNSGSAERVQDTH